MMPSPDPVLVEVVVPAAAYAVDVYPQAPVAVDAAVTAGLPGPPGPAGASGHASLFRWNETPAGAIDGANAVFTLADPPDPPASLMLFKNGLLMRAGAGNDFALAGTTITFDPAQTPHPGDALAASYATT